MKARYATRRVTSRGTPNLQEHINTLPTELLAEIFLLLHIDSTESYGMKTFVKTTILPVCRRWRTIIETTPVFWAEIRIVPLNGPREADHLLQRLQTAVTRAGLLPLHIIWDHPPDVENNTFAELISYLFEYAPTSRWKELTVHNDRLESLSTGPQPFSILQRITVTEGPKYHVLHLLEDSRATIERVKIHFSTLGSMFIHAPSVLRSAVDVEVYNNILTSDHVLFKHFPNVQTLRRDGITRDVSLSRGTHLIELHLTDVDIVDISSLGASKIETLYIQHLDSAFPCERITIPTLRALKVSWGEFWPLRFLDSPNLESLVLGMRTGSLNSGTEVMVRTLEEPEYSLSPIAATLDVPVTVGGFAWFLRRSERLQDLSLLLDKRACNKVDELINVFSRQTVLGNFLCPELRAIRLVLRWSQASPKKGGLQLIPSDSWRGVAGKILAVRSGTPLTSIECVWEGGFKETMA
jgi:hypothetical protein